MIEVIDKIRILLEAHCSNDQLILTALPMLSDEIIKDSFKSDYSTPLALTCICRKSPWSQSGLY